jgi:hypothetical protein
VPGDRSLHVTFLTFVLLALIDPAARMPRGIEDDSGGIKVTLRISRRHLIRGGFAALGLLAIPANLIAGSASPPSRIRATRWIDRGPAGRPITGSVSGGQYLSPIYRSPYPINAIGSFWVGTVKDFAVRYSVDGTTWSGWQTVTFHVNHLRAPDAAGRRFGDLIIAPDTRYVQYRFTIVPGISPEQVSLELIDSAQGPLATTSPLQTQSESVQTLPIISRSGWGCDESLRFDANGNVIWPCEYRTIQKSIVHHTATPNFEDDPAATVRAIYYYHAVTLGWGDIGYNYLVDWRGNVYEGRYGGDKVVGGHTYWYSHNLTFNYGTVGIGNLGTFTTTYPTTAMRQSLARLIAWKAQYIDPHGNTYFMAGFLPNLLGHRDCVPTPTGYETECPGDAMESLLPGIRGDVSWNMDGLVPTPNGQIVSAKIGTFATPGETLPVQFVIRNTGTGVMIPESPGEIRPEGSTAPGTVFVYNEGDTYASRGYPEIQGCWRVGVDYDGNSTGRDHPYRWGLSDALNPGESATINGQITLMTSGTRRYWAGLVQESVQWVQDGVGTTSVVVKELTPRAYLPLVSR